MTTTPTWGPRWCAALRPKRVEIPGTGGREITVQVPALVRVDGTAAARRHARVEGGAGDGDGAPRLTPAERAALERDKGRARQRVLEKLLAAGRLAQNGGGTPGHPPGALSWAAEVPAGGAIALKRREKGWSQRDLAAAAGMSRGLVADVERGRRTHWLPRWKLAEKLGMMGAEEGAGA